MTKTCPRCQARFREPLGGFQTCPACRRPIPAVLTGCHHWSGCGEGHRVTKEHDMKPRDQLIR